MQLLLAKSILLDERKKVSRLRTICGVDAAYSSDDLVVAVASTFDSTKGELIEQKKCIGRASFPYISGLFFLREGPFVTDVVRRLDKKPDLICFDAHGVSHPRHLGLASICGMLLKIPSIGIAKSKLFGKAERYEPRMSRLVEDAENGRRRHTGFVTLAPNRYWSPGYSISIRELEHIIRNHGEVCENSITASHLEARRYLSERKQ